MCIVQLSSNDMELSYHCFKISGQLLLILAHDIIGLKLDMIMVMQTAIYAIYADAHRRLLTVCSWVIIIMHSPILSSISLLIVCTSIGEWL